MNILYAFLYELKQKHHILPLTHPLLSVLEGPVPVAYYISYPYTNYITKEVVKPL